jgi:hypothetical protein
MPSKKQEEHKQGGGKAPRRQTAENPAMKSAAVRNHNGTPKDVRIRNGKNKIIIHVAT